VWDVVETWLKSQGGRVQGKPAPHQHAEAGGHAGNPGIDNTVARSR
jgi:hypothetical protein